jgi:hypothetical protein
VFEIDDVIDPADSRKVIVGVLFGSGNGNNNNNNNNNNSNNKGRVHNSNNNEVVGNVMGKL